MQKLGEKLMYVKAMYVEYWQIYDVSTSTDLKVTATLSYFIRPTQLVYTRYIEWIQFD